MRETRTFLAVRLKWSGRMNNNLRDKRVQKNKYDRENISESGEINELSG